MRITLKAKKNTFTVAKFTGDHKDQNHYTTELAKKQLPQLF
jgi:hypothetical protein